MAPQRGNHQIIVDDRVWSGLMMTAHSKRPPERIADYLEPFFVEILRLEKAGIDPLEVLKKAGKGGK